MIKEQRFDQLIINKNPCVRWSYTHRDFRYETKQSITHYRQKHTDQDHGNYRRVIVSVKNRTSTVGLPRLSKIWRALTAWIVIAIGEERFLVERESVREIERRVGGVHSFKE